MGSDVNHLVFNVLPVLNKGVIVHFHDIFLPREYPFYWVVQEKLSWNEQYLIRALLTGSKIFEVVFGCMYAYCNFSPELRTVVSEEASKGGSLWLRKVRPYEATPPSG